MKRLFSLTRALVARKRKIFALFFALAASIGMSWATVITWDQSKVSSMAMNVSSGSDSKTSDGITVTAVSTGEVVLFGDGGAIEIGNGEGSGGGYLTFTSSVGNIAQIDINHSGAGEWRNANGDWISPYYENFDGGIFTWSGTPAASITLTGDAPRHIENITSIEFTIEDAATAVTGVTLNKSAAELTVGGENLTLIPTVLPSNATNKEVMWPGTANITVTTVEGDYSATCVVTVTDAAPANVCGDGLTWELSEGVLTISYDGEGTGEMTDFGYENDQNPVNVAPWKENKSEITTVIVGDGVKSIGNYAFNDLSENLKAVTIANSVERIGVFAFTNSEEITEITLPSSLKTIDEQCFANCGFTSITIPSGVTSIGYKAFSWCRNLTSLTSEATTPPTLASSVFYKISNTSSIPLYVPSGSVTAYEAAAQWNAFDIQGYDPAPGGGSTPAGTVTVVFEANNNQKEVEVTLPHTFACDFENGNGELDGIIQELYALQYGGYCPAFNVPTATGNEAVTASKDGNNHYIAISEAFEGTATVTGNYIKYLDTEHMGNTSVDYTLTISVQGSAPAPTEPAANLKLIEFQAPASWENDNSPITSADFPGFVATTYEIASALPINSDEPSLVIFDFPENDEVTVYTKMGEQVKEPSTGTIVRSAIFENAQAHYYYPVLAGGASATTVTWNSSNISDLIVFSISESYSKEGVTLSGNADKIEAYWYGSDENNSGISFHANATGGFTFSNTLGKNFTKIEMTLNVPGGWNYANLGSGWNIDGMKAIWTGNASTVDLLKDESGFNSTPVKSIVFYFEGDSEGGGSTDVIPCTAADLGKVLCTDGSIYATVSEATAANKTAVAMIAYVDTENGKALALALADESGEMEWATATTTAPAHTPAVSGGTWTLASKDEWDNMITAAGSYTALQDGFSAVGGTNMQQNAYWSSTSFMHYAWCYKFNNGEWFDDYQDAENYVRACLAFDIPAAPAYETVMNLINAIGEVAYTAECKAKIDEARAAYNALSDGDKEQVTNSATLTDAEEAYKNLVLDAAQPAIAAIKAIPSPITSNLKLSAYEKVTAAREAYDALTDEEKAAIPEYLAFLEEAEAAFAAIPSVGSETVITWDKNTGIEEIGTHTTTPAYEGITLSTKGGMFGPNGDMLRFYISISDICFEFANTLGANFSKIVLSSTSAIPSTRLTDMGEGWAASNENKTATWTGDAATVKIWDGLTATSYWDVNTIQFTLGATVSATEAAQAAKDLIEAIGEVSYPGSKEAIKAAREAVDALGANASLLDDADLQKLTQAEAAYAQLLAQAVAAVKDQIDALPDTPLTDATKKLSEYNKVTDAREAYDALSDEEKAAVTNYDKLEAAEAAFAAIGGGVGLNVSTEDIGKVLCADGSLYATKDEATAASKTPVAMIAYVEDSKGLAIALEDESNTMIWSTAITAAAAHTPAVTGGTWKLPSLLEWQQMFVGCGADLTPSETSGNVTDYLGLRDKLLAAGGNGFVEWSYWTTTEWADNPAEAWDPYFSFDPELVKWYKNKKDRDDFYIRAILAFNVVASTALADAQAAKDLIDAIPQQVVVTDECKAKIDAAREAVTALGENASLLDDADIDKLAKAEADFALLIKDATAVVDMIDAIDEVTFSPESKEKIVDAREAYDALSDELKPYVSNIDKLTAAEAAYEAARPFATVTTVPAAVEALQYTGAAQTLITAGAAEHGTVLYSLDGENYSTELPTALLAGAYTIYYKVQATDDYKDVAPVTVIATIAYNYPATYGLFGIPEGWSVKVNDEEVAVVNGAVKNIAANDRFDIMPVKPEDVKRVEIVPYLLDLATVTDSVIYILDGDSITGTANGHITVVIVPDAKVYFKDVNLTNTGSHPAVLCGGNAEIVVVGENTITCTKEGEYGIRAAGAGTTLTVSGDKTLLKATIDPNGGTVNQ